MKNIYWIAGIVVLLIALVLGYYYFQQVNTKCEFGGDADKCNTICETDTDCKFSIGYCININENVFLPEGVMPSYTELTCKCENNRCVGNSTGRIAI